MKTITIPSTSMSLELRTALRNPDVLGRYIEFPVMVDWFPRLTEEQIIQNVIARQNGEPAPHHDPNLISVKIDLL